MMERRDYQIEGTRRAVSFLRTAPRGAHDLCAAPTGSGKSLIHADAMKELNAGGNVQYFCIAPNYDILRGIGEKAGLHNATQDDLESHGFYTPIRLRNELLRGVILPPKGLLIDETHHWENATQDILDALTDECPCFGLTATPFRGTAKSTLAFRKRWGKPTWLITLREAAKRGIVALPHCKIVPVLDDDKVKLTNGEFQVQDLEERTMDVFKNIEVLIRRYFNTSYDRPTMIAAPGVWSAKMIASRLNEAGLPAVCITGEDDTEDRDAAFTQCVNGTHVLVQVRVVSEGVDLPIRRLIDLAPKMSPVEWQQQFGRITRPSDTPPEYICCNRNLLRHAYLLDGLLPNEIYKQAEQEFPPTERAAYRSLGFESLGKFKATEVPLKSGLKALLYCINKVEGTEVTEYAALAAPLHPDVLYVKRVNVRGTNGNTYGRWVSIDALPDIMEGYSSVQKGSLTPKQRKFWEDAAESRGLDKTATVNKKQFVALPVLLHTDNAFL